MKSNYNKGFSEIVNKKNKRKEKGRKIMTKKYFRVPYIFTTFNNTFGMTII